VKLFCDKCNRIEAFNPIAAQDFLTHFRYGVVTNRIPDVKTQVFVLSYECQSCKSPPEVFLVRRFGLKLTLSGRAPIEHVEVPSDIPREVQKFYAGAIVAHQSGQTLAGLFLLRTLIEQWARLKISDQETQADKVLEKYMATLPPDFRQRFASIKEIYGDISADIHMAIGSEELFDKKIKDITEHFEACKLFKL
jgi:hypothetical protein